VVPAPIGASITVLPDGYTVVPVSGASYYYYGGAYYTRYSGGYRVVGPPVGAVVVNLPDGAAEATISGNRYLVYNNTYYQPVVINGENSYEVVDIRAR
jgi:hypothetical protein